MIPFAIHVDGVGLVVLRKTCRLCVKCELLIVHQAEIEPLIAASVGRAVVTHPRTWWLARSILECGGEACRPV